MTTPPVSEDEYVNRLYDQIRAELVEIFGHSTENAHALLATYYEKYPDYDEDIYFHQGPFNMALRIQYDQVLGKDTSDHEYIEWRKAYDPLWNDRLRGDTGA